MENCKPEVDVAKYAGSRVSLVSQGKSFKFIKKIHIIYYDYSLHVCVYV